MHPPPNEMRSQPGMAPPAPPVAVQNARAKPPMTLWIALTLTGVLLLSELALIIFDISYVVLASDDMQFAVFHVLASMAPVGVNLFLLFGCSVWLLFGKEPARMLVLAFAGALAIGKLSQLPLNIVPIAEDPEFVDFVFAADICLNIVLATAVVILLSSSKIHAWLRARQPQPAATPHASAAAVPGQRPTGIIPVAAILCSLTVASAVYALLEMSDRWHFVEHYLGTIAVVASHTIPIVIGLVAAALTITGKKLGWPLAVATSGYMGMKCIGLLGALAGSLAMGGVQPAEAPLVAVFLAALLVPLAASVLALILLGGRARMDWFYAEPSITATGQQDGSNQRL